MNKLFFVFVFLTFCGLFLFIVGLKLLTTVLNKISSNKIRQLIIKFSDKDFKALLLGIIVTAICQSSNAITAITLSFVSAKYLDFRKGLIIIIGSNIGTTVTSILFGLNIQNFGFVFIILGIILLKFLNNKNIGLLIVSLGILLFGLNNLSNYLECLLSLDNVSPILVKVNSSNFLCFCLGTVISFIMQSSSASIGMIQQLHQENMIGLSCGIAFVLGANIGTTITGLIAGFFGNISARKVALFNFLFNFFGSLLFLVVIIPYTTFIKNLQFYFNISNSLTISLSHILYNIITVLLFIIGLLFFTKRKEKSL